MSGERENDGSAGLDIRRVGGRIGAEIRGVRLSGDLSDASVRAILHALHTHKVVFFRDQTHLDDVTQEAFAARLGEPAPHPTARIAAGKYLMELADGAGGNVWHTDVTFTRDYPSASILRQLVSPEYGGDTIWANGAEAYKRLPDQLRVLADSLWAVHANAGFRAGAFPNRTPIQAEHPVVQVHPVTGERILVLGVFARWLVGFGETESRRIIDLLQGYMTRPENTVRWSWRVGDVAIWDNRATMHYAVYDYGDQHRVMRRVTLEGPTPVGVDGRRSRSIEAAPAAPPAARTAAMAGDAMA